MLGYEWSEVGIRLRIATRCQANFVTFHLHFQACRENLFGRCSVVADYSRVHDYMDTDRCLLRNTNFSDLDTGLCMHLMIARIALKH